MTIPAPAIDAELSATLRQLKLGQLAHTLPERLALAKTNKLSHAEFLQIVLADEVTRRDTTSASRRARAAGLDPTMTLQSWDATAKVSFDRHVFDELCSLRFVDTANNAIIMGPVGVGKTFLAAALGHIAVRRRRSVHFERADHLFKRLRVARLDNSLDAELRKLLRVARLDNSLDAELRKLLRVDVLIIDDFALSALDSTATTDFYETVVERHRRASTIISSNRDPSEWLALMTDPLLAQSAVDRLKSAAYELVVEGESYRDRQRPTVPD
jgi:DNA replication protein DnaC